MSTNVNVHIIHVCKINSENYNSYKAMWMFTWVITLCYNLLKIIGGTQPRQPPPHNNKQVQHWCHTVDIYITFHHIVEWSLGVLWTSKMNNINSDSNMNIHIIIHWCECSHHYTLLWIFTSVFTTVIKLVINTNGLRALPVFPVVPS